MVESRSASPMITLAGTSTPPCRIRYSALRQAPSRASTAVASIAFSIAHAVDRDQNVALVDARFFAGTVREHENSHHLLPLVPPALVQPGDAVIGQVELALLLEIDRRGDHRRNRDNHQQRADELLLKFPHTPRSYTPPITYRARRSPTPSCPFCIDITRLNSNKRSRDMICGRILYTVMYPIDTKGLSAIPPRC